MSRTSPVKNDIKRDAGHNTSHLNPFIKNVMDNKRVSYPDIPKCFQNDEFGKQYFTAEEMEVRQMRGTVLRANALADNTGSEKEYPISIGLIKEVCHAEEFVCKTGTGTNYCLKRFESTNEDQEKNIKANQRWQQISELIYMCAATDPKKKVYKKEMVWGRGAYTDVKTMELGMKYTICITVWPDALDQDDCLQIKL